MRHTHCELPRRLHLGCGLTTPAGWTNVDGSWNARLAKHRRARSVATRLGLIPPYQAQVPWSAEILAYDLRRPLPFPSNYFSAAYASHLLEHLYTDEASRLLHECFRVLQSGASVRIVVPDLEAIAKEYVSSLKYEEGEGSAADRMNERLHLRGASAPSGKLPYRLYSLIKDFHLHKWMYDAGSLSSRLRDAGFAGVRQRGFLDSQIPGIEEVEATSRVLHGAGVCVEGTKP